jgi:hypothetical protein
MLTMGDFAGQDILFPANPRTEKYTSQAVISIGQNKDPKPRKESAYAESETYLLEFQLHDWKKTKDLLLSMRLNKDYKLLEKHLI